MTSHFIVLMVLLEDFFIFKIQGNVFNLSQTRVCFIDQLVVTLTYFYQR